MLPVRRGPFKVTTAELLEAWREATRAAELAEQLTKFAEEAADQADANAAASEEVAELAEKVAEAASAAAASARGAAERAAALAASRRSPGVGDARRIESDAVAHETEAREAYHHAEEEARHRIGRDGTDLQVTPRHARDD